MDVEFKCPLINGREVFCMAIVTDSVEIVCVQTSDDSDAVEIPLSDLTRLDLDLIEYWASQQAFEDEARNRSEAI